MCTVIVITKIDLYYVVEFAFDIHHWSSDDSVRLVKLIWSQTFILNAFFWF